MLIIVLNQKYGLVKGNVLIFHKCEKIKLPNPCRAKQSKLNCKSLCLKLVSCLQDWEGYEHWWLTELWKSPHIPWRIPLPGESKAQQNAFLPKKEERICIWDRTKTNVTVYFKRKELFNSRRFNKITLDNSTHWSNRSI